jgi:hypothetical protein
VRRRTLGVRLGAALLVAATAVTAGCNSSSSTTSTRSGSGVASASAGSGAGSGKQVLRVFGWGVETAPALGGEFPPQTYLTTVPQAVTKVINANPSSKVTIQFTFCDTKFTATGSLQCAQQATSPTGCSGSPCDVAIDLDDITDNLSVPAIGAKGLPIVGTVVNSPQALDTPDDFCITGGPNSVQQGLGYVLKSEGAHKVGLIMYTSPLAQPFINWAAQGAHANGLTVGGQQSPSVTAVDNSPTIDAVLAGGGDGLWFNVTNIGGALKYVETTFKNAKVAFAGYQVQPGLFNGFPNSMTAGVGVAAWAQPLTATSIPGVAQYWKEVGSAAGSLFKYYDNSLLVWLGLHFIANVADTISGPISEASMLTALKSAQNVNMYGVMPPWTASARGTNGAISCSPYHVFVPETLKNGIQEATHPGVFLDPLTGKTAYADPGAAARTS